MSTRFVYDGEEIHKTQNAYNLKMPIFANIIYELAILLAGDASHFGKRPEVSG